MPGPVQPPADELARLNARVERERRARAAAEAVAEKALRDAHQQQRELQLLQAIAAAANASEAVGPAMQVALDQICAVTGWPVGHAYLLADQAADASGATTLWRMNPPARFALFWQATEAKPLVPGVDLPGRVLASGRPEWLTERTPPADFPRAEVAREAGLCGGFAFPVLAGAEVVAVVEFFSTEPVTPNAPWQNLLLEVGTHLGRVVSRRRAGQVLARSEQSFRASFENSPLGKYRMTPGGEIVLANAALLTLLDYPSLAELAAARVLPTAAADQPIREELRARLEQTGEARGFESVWLRRDGTRVLVRENVRAVRDGDGNTAFFEGSVEDVTERQEAESARRESEEQLRLALRAAHMGTWEWDLAADEVVLAENTEALFGVPLDRLRGPSATFLHLVHPADRDHVLQNLVHAVETGRNCSMEYRVVWPDESIHWIAAFGRLVSAAGRGKTRLSGVSMDITERKRGEAALRESEEKFRAIVETTREWIWSMDCQGRLTYSNPSVALILGYQPEELLNRSFLEFMHEDDRQQVADLLPMFIADKWGWKDSVSRWRHKDGSCRYLERNATPILDPNGELLGYQGTDRDISERKVAEQALEEERASLARRVDERTAELSTANLQLAKAARLKDEFLASMSHELRTPLNAVLGLSEVLQEQIYGALNDKQLQSLRSIEESGRHLLSLINDILDLSKIEAGKVQLDFDTVDIESVCHASLRLVKEVAQKKKVKLAVQLDPRAPTVWADERRLKQILVNLLSNAVKFTPEGGSVGLEIAAHPEQKVIYFTVTDTGIGIAAENIPRLFQPFVQLDSRLARQFGGTGLGLALVHRMVEMHGGSISVQSEPGQGSRFAFSVPQVEARPVVTETPASPAVVPAAVVTETGPPRAPTRILLAEDNEVNIQSMTAYLESKGFVLAIARDGEEAVQQARELNPDLILMDIQMPGVDGLEATRRIRQEPERSDVPIIAVTALAMSGDRERCLEAGANDYMSKPVNLKELVKRIEAQLRRRPATVVPS